MAVSYHKCFPQNKDQSEVIIIYNEVVVIPPTQRSCKGVYWFHSVRPSVCLSVRPSACPSVRPASRVCSVASIVQDGFFPYLVQMITSMRGCVACDDPWPWPIPSRSFSLDLENSVCSVASTVLDGFSLYLAQMITIVRGCASYYVFFQNLEIWTLSKFLKFFGLDLEKKIYSSWWILSIFSTDDH